MLNQGLTHVAYKKLDLVLALLLWSMAACTYHLDNYPRIVFIALAKLGVLRHECTNCAEISVSKNEFDRDAALCMFLWVVKCQVRSIFII